MLERPGKMNPMSHSSRINIVILEKIANFAPNCLLLVSS